MKLKDKKKTQLGISHGTASHRLVRSLLFKMVKEIGLDVCFQCGEKIKTIRELSIEHKIPWLDSEDPVGLYFDLDNIAFSHLSCNCANSRKYHKHKTDEDRIAAHRASVKKNKNKDGKEARKKKRREDYLKYGH